MAANKGNRCRTLSNSYSAVVALLSRFAGHRLRDSPFENETVCRLSTKSRQNNRDRTTQLSNVS